MNHRYCTEPARQEEAAAVLRISPEDMRRTAAYATDGYRFGLASRWTGAVAELAFVALGGLGVAERWSLAAASHLLLGPVGVGLVFFALLGLASGALSLPFDLYETFVLEQRHGFNRQTLRGFLADRGKGLLLGAVLGGALLGTLLLVMQRAGEAWWLYAWIAVTAFSLFTVWIYPTLLAPLFNTFTPLPEGELKEKIEALAARVGFRTRGVLVMDASRRSAHGNAYFTGLFGAKRIVLFDTLLQDLGAREIAAILAHELGHFKLGHVRWSLVRSTLLTGAFFYALGLCAPLTPFYGAFGLRGPSSYGALAVFSLWFGLPGFLLRPVLSLLSRRDEFAADSFAVAAMGGPQGLGQGLLRLRDKSRVMPISHPLFSAVYHSHPPLVERLRAMGYH